MKYVLCVLAGIMSVFFFTVFITVAKELIEIEEMLERFEKATEKMKPEARNIISDFECCFMRIEGYEHSIKESTKEIQSAVDYLKTNHLRSRLSASPCPMFTERPENPDAPKEVDDIKKSLEQADADAEAQNQKQSEETILQLKLGVTMAREEIAKRMLIVGELSVDSISTYTRLSTDEVEKLKYKDYKPLPINLKF